MEPRSLYAAFLYGLNIPGGRWLTTGDVERALLPLRPSMAFAGIVGRPDSLLLTASDTTTEAAVRRAVSEALDCPCVVIATGMANRIVAGAVEAVRAAGHSATPPYRITSDDVEWEWCLVLSAERLPPRADSGEWLFNPTANAVALKVLERRALLARKRRRTPRGARVMLGAALLNPWEAVLERKGVTVACLTSRTLNRVAAIVAVAARLDRSVSD